MDAVRIDYEYRDAHNYKRHGSWTVAGTPDAAALDATLHEGRFFVPDAVGMPMLCPGGGEWDGEVDHPVHSILSIQATDAPTDEDRTFDALLAAFRSADWTAAGVEHEIALS